MFHRPRGRKAQQIQVSERQKAWLEALIRRAYSPQFLVLRAKIILLAATGKGNQQIAHELQVHVQTVRRWRQRWSEAGEKLIALENEADDKTLSQAMEGVLADEARSGTPATFTAEQVCQIVAIACEPVGESDRPVSHWTPRELADEAVKRQIVERISPRSVQRFLKGGRPKTASIALLAQS